MPKKNAEALKLPDQLLVRYFRGDELDQVNKVTVKDSTVAVELRLPAGKRIDRWRDLGGGLGYVPDAPEG